MVFRYFVFTNFNEHWRHLALLFVVLLSFPSTYSQSAFDTFSIRQLTLEDGLSQVSSNDLLLDNSGFLWIATQDGLNRYDGNEFKHFKHSDKDSNSLSGNFTNKLLQDSKGNIWVGTVGNGLNYYNPITTNFHRIKLENSKDDNEIISGLIEDKDGSIWVASRISGLHKLDFLPNKNIEQTHYLNDIPISTLFYDNQGYLWAGGFEGDIYMFDKKNVKGFQKNTKIQVSGNVQALFNTGDQLLIGSDFGFFIHDFGKKITTLVELESSGIFKTKHVVDILPRDSETVWIATGNGLYLFNWHQKKVISKIQYVENSNKGLSNNTVQSLLHISDGLLAVGTANALNLIDFGNPYFNNLSKNKRGKHLLNDNVVFSILKDGEDLWIGTSDGGVNLVRKEKVYYFKDDENNPQSISGSVVRAIVKDELNKRMWLATTRGLNMIDLSEFDPESPKFKVFHHDPENLNSINGDFLKDIALDKNNNLWGATFGHGIFRLEMDETETVKIIRYEHESNRQHSLINDFTSRILVDKDNRILVATQGGLSKLSFSNTDYENHKIENFYKVDNSSNSLSHNSIYDILIDKEERIWLGTRHGLNRFLGKNKFQSWTEQDQYPNAIVYSIQDDDEGNLWLGTNDGLVKYDPDDNVFSLYGVDDGIQSKEFDLHAKYKDGSGTIYMGGVGGVTYFQPKNLKELDEPKPIYFSQLKIKDEFSGATNSFGILEKALLKTNKLEFKQNQFPFYLQFSTLDYSPQKNYQYGYKLLPSDDEWNMLDNTEIQFLNLPSGNYKLIVNGFSRGKEWKQPPVEMTLSVLPPIWATWWAYGVYVIILGSLAYWFYHFKLSKKLAIAESIKLKDLNNLRSNLYTNITHEFRTPLTVILGLADTVKDDLEAQNYQTVNEAMTIIERNGKDLLLLVNQLLGISKAESGTMELNLIQADVVPFLRYICESFQSLAKTENIDITTYFETERLLMDFDDGKLQIIISNLLSNAIKFSSDGTKIIFHVKSETINDAPSVVIKIKDEGVGIPEKALPHIFDRFYQVETVLSKSGKGTGIGLTLTKELVTLMKGSIAVKSTEKKGTEFTVSLPITRDCAITSKIMNNPVDLMADNTVEQPWSLQVFDKEVNLPKALIIEDNKDVAYYLRLCLQNKYHCLFANNGNLGIEKAFEKIPDIIVSDIMMPERDGFEVCEILKTDQRTDHIPIILLTAKTSEKDRLKGLQHGADAYLTKPFLKAELLTRIDQLIILRKRITQSFAKNKFSQILNSTDITPETKFLQRVIQIIQDNIDNHNLGSRHVAQKMGLSESQIYRKLKAITGKSTAVFIRSVRLEKAKDLLQTTDKTISEIAYDVGFNDPSWFSRAYKEEFGESPSATHK